ncbi:MAG TPA: NUDIX domain-containing protein [Patescibacteria group bacterium]|nr:NUDIX domain-containing protein [Patescibacteria group bacterium]
MRKVIEGEKHFTVSAWILTKTKPAKVLLILHKKFNKWIQPGGHIEEFENPIDAVIREAKEESGIDISFLANDIVIGNEVKFLPNSVFFMEQTIPEHKGQPSHFHLDFSYVVKVDEQEINQSELNNDQVGWFTKEEALKLDTHLDTKTILKKIM